ILLLLLILKMVCIGFLSGCNHDHSTKSYILPILMVIGIIIGLRILCSAILRLLRRRQQAEQAHETDQTSNDGIEMIMQSETTRIQRQQQLLYQHIFNRETKFVILAGDNQVTFLAIPKPIQTINIV
ncbi:hypothetical protein FRX31_022940, partial [Thalictrum thalictroides]